MIVEVVPEGLDVRDVLVAALRCQMAGEENYDVSNWPQANSPTKLPNVT